MRQANTRIKEMTKFTDAYIRHPNLMYTVNSYQ